MYCIIKRRTFCLIKRKNKYNIYNLKILNGSNVEKYGYYILYKVGKKRNGKFISTKKLFGNFLNGRANGEVILTISFTQIFLFCFSILKLT